MERKNMAGEFGPREDEIVNIDETKRAIEELQKVKEEAQINLEIKQIILKEFKGWEEWKDKTTKDSKMAEEIGDRKEADFWLGVRNSIWRTTYHEEKCEEAEKLRKEKKYDEADRINNPLFALKMRKEEEAVDIAGELVKTKNPKPIEEAIIELKKVVEEADKSIREKESTLEFHKDKK